MKAYTNVEQSKKLAEILSIESADCYWDYDEMQKFHRISWFEDGYNKESQLILNENNVCAWSLAALLNSVKYNTINLHYNDVRNDWIASCTVEHSTRYESGRALNPVDACVEMILKLHELNLM